MISENLHSNHLFHAIGSDSQKRAKNHHSCWIIFYIYVLDFIKNVCVCRLEYKKSIFYELQKFFSFMKNVILKINIESYKNLKSISP